MREERVESEIFKLQCEELASQVDRGQGALVASRNGEEEDESGQAEANHWFDDAAGTLSSGLDGLCENATSPG